MAEEGVVIPVSLEPDLASTQKAGEEMGQKLTKVLEQNANIDLSDKLRKAEMQAKNLYSKFQTLSSKINDLRENSTPINAKEVERASKEVNRLTEALKKEQEKLVEVTEKAEKFSQPLTAKAESEKIKAVEKLDAAWQKADQSAKQYDAARLRAENKFLSEHGLSEKYRETAIETLKQTNSYSELLRKIKQYSDEVARLQAEREKLDAKPVSEFISEKDAEKLKEYNAKVNELTDSVTRLQAELSGKELPLLEFGNYEGTEEYKQDLRELEDVVNRLKMTMGTLESPVDQSNDALAVMGRVAVKTANNISNLVKKLASLAKTAIQTSIRKLGDSIKGIGTDSEKSNISLDKLFKTFVKYGLGARSFFLLFRRIRSAIIDVFQELGKENFGEVGKSVNSLADSLSYLKNSFVTAFAPIVNFVTPAINALISSLANLMSTIGAFFSLLTGKGTYMKAIKQTGTLADKTKQGAEAQKEWKNELYAFDELNRQQETKDNDSGGGGGAGTDFEEVPIGGALSDWLKDWIERLKEAWKTENFYKIGQLLAEGLDHVLIILDDWINNVFRPWGVKWAKNIADIVNGFFESWYLWKDLGKTISDGLAAVLDIAATFLENVHWDSISKAFGIMLNTVFANSDMWTQIARFVAAKINALFDFIKGFLDETISYAQSYGERIWRTIVDIVRGIHWDTIAEDIVRGVNWVIKFITGFLLQKETWQEVSDTLSAFINKIITEMDLDGLGKALNELLGRILAFLRDIDWYQLGYKIGQFLGEIDWLDILSTIGKIIVDSLWGAINGFLSTDEGKATAFAGLFVSLLAGAFTIGFEFLKLEITKGLAASILNPTMLASGQATTLLGTVGSAFTNLGGVISGAFGAIASAAAPIAAVVGVVLALSAAYGGLGGVVEKVSDVFENTIERVKEFAKQIGISEAIDKLKTSFGNLMDMLAKLKPVWDALFAAIGAVVEGVLNMVIGVITGLATAISGIIDVIVGALTIIGDAFTDTHGNVEQSLTMMATGIMNIFVGISKAVIGIVGGFIQSVIDFFADLKYQLIGDPIIIDLWEGIKNIFAAGIKFVIDAIISFISDLITAFTNFLNDALKVFTSMWNAIKTATASTWNAINSVISTIINSIKTTVTNIVTALKTDVISRWDELKSTTLSKFNTLKSSVVNLWNALKSTLKSISFVDIGRGIVNGIKNGINELWDSLKEGFFDKIRDLVDGAKNLLQINSPSKVFTEIGKNVALGLAYGISDENAPEKATEEMIDSITDVDAALNSMPDSFDTIIDKLSVIADKFTIINDTLMNASRLPMPAVAAGMVTPSFVNTSSNDEPNLADSIANAISLAFENMPTNTNVGNSDIKIYIRGKEVFDAVVEENNSVIMRTGKSPLTR